MHAWMAGSGVRRGVWQNVALTAVVLDPLSSASSNPSIGELHIPVVPERVERTPRPSPRHKSERWAFARRTPRGSVF